MTAKHILKYTRRSDSLPVYLFPEHIVGFVPLVKDEHGKKVCVGASIKTVDGRTHEVTAMPTTILEDFAKLYELTRPES